MTAVRLLIERTCLGEFEVRSGALCVGDPCCYPFTTQARTGTWFAFLEKAPFGAWGRRNTRLQVLHADFLGYDLSVICRKPETKVVGVDAGLVAIVDANEPFDLDAAVDAQRDAIVDAVGAEAGRGVLVSSGLGDGAYDTTLHLRDDEAVVIDIEFIGETEVRLAQCTLPGVDELPVSLRPDLRRVEREAINASGPPVPVWLARPVEELQWVLPLGVDIAAHRQWLWECVELEEGAFNALQERCCGRTPALMTDGVTIFVLGEYEGYRGLWKTHSLCLDGTMARSVS